MKIAITGLVRGYPQPVYYHHFGLIERNQTIYNIIYKNNEEMFDIILFHEGNISEEHQHYIQMQTPNLPIQFINVSEEFKESLIKTTSKYCTQSVEKYWLGYNWLQLN